MTAPGAEPLWLLIEEQADGKIQYRLLESAGGRRAGCGRSGSGRAAGRWSKATSR